MRLVDLNPRWFAEPGRHGQGLSFDCPHCAGGVRLSAPFTVPLDGGAPISLEHGVLWPTLQPRPDDAPGRVTVPPGIHWTRTGDTFETMTLVPSIDASRSGHWHGFITNGAIVNA